MQGMHGGGGLDCVPYFLTQNVDTPARKRTLSRSPIPLELQNP